MALGPSRGSISKMSEKNLLIGNGLNLRLGIKKLNVEDIKERFVITINRNIPIINVLLNGNYDNKVLDAIDGFKNESIEALASKLYLAIHAAVGNEKWSDNYEIRLQELMKCMAMNAIFYTSAGQIEAEFDETKLLDFDSYENIFTLNYFEFWDKHDVCNYLHGKFNLNNAPKGKDVLIGSINQRQFKPYDALINEMRHAGERVVLINVPDIIFSPDVIEKQELYVIKGLRPSSKLFPAKDLVPSGPRDPYEKLRYIHQLDVFGMSPYGDDSLISELRNLDEINIYVHNSDNEQIKEWKKKLKGCNYHIHDSSEI